jgi:hypothetical protein
LREALAAIEPRLTLRTIALNSGSFTFMNPELKIGFRAPSTPFLSGIATAQEDARGELLAKQIAENWFAVATELAALLALPDEKPGKPRRLLLDTSANLARLPWEFMTALNVDRPNLVRFPALGTGYQGPDDMFRSFRQMANSLR